MSRFGQQLTQKQQQKLSPLQIQQVKLLELTGVEMEERIEREIEENPALEESTDPSAEIEENVAEDSTESDLDAEEIALGDYSSEDDIPDYYFHEKYSARNEQKEEIPYSEGESFTEYLINQFHLKILTDKQTVIGEHLIGNIDDDGYIRRDLTAISDDLAFQCGIEASAEEIKTVLEIVQTLEPAGIGATNLQNCLLLQLKRKEPTTVCKTAIRLLETCFDEFSKMQYDKILNTLGISENELKTVISEIKTLNPRPGNAWESNMETKMAQITPDFTVENLNGELVLNMQDNIPPLCVSKAYVEMLDEYSKTDRLSKTEKNEAVAFVRDKIDSARWFIDAIKQRQITLRKTMAAIIRLQRDFFLSGEESDLKPMILKDVADASGYDISTVSRVSNQKYVQTQFGVFPLKYFFSETVIKDGDKEISTREIKSELKKIIDGEDKSNPLNDDSLMNLLQKNGYNLARRTVAKYREQMNIPVARMRKAI